MKKLISILVLSVVLPFSLFAQKSKVIAVFQLIENSKYEEAKEIIEESLKEDRTRQWPRTWYARGLLCQNAYREGKKKNDEDLYALYPDQLYVAFNSYERTRYLDKRGRYDKHLAPLYVLLANDFREMGENYYKKKNFEEALKAFEFALRINQSTILSEPLDTNLLYNTALTAYKSRKWDDAIDYLTKLNEGKYSPNVPHLLFSIYISKSDTAAAENVLLEGIKKYNENEELVLLLVDLFFEEKNPEKAVSILDEAFSRDTANYIFPYTKGLLYQKMEHYQKAIKAYEEALTLPSDTTKLYSSIGTCYYNIGAGIEENARTITNNRAFLLEKEKSAAAFKSALEWFEKAYERDPEDENTVKKLNLLYRVLDVREERD